MGPQNLSLTHTVTHISYAHVLMQKKKGRGGGRGRRAPQKAWFLPCSLHRSSQQVISLTRNPVEAPDAWDEILQKPVRWKDKKGDSFCQVFLCWDGLKSLCFMPGITACQTTRIKDLIVWITSLIYWCHWAVLQVLMCQVFFLFFYWGGVPSGS